jgi:hypothetical protein
VDAAALLCQGKVLGRLLVLKVVGSIDDECVQYGMRAAMPSDPKTR